MKSAILAVVEGGITKKAAAAKYGIPRTTLIEKLSGKYREGKGPGRDPYLTDDEEEAIATGLPPHKNDILNTVQRLIKDIPGRESPFQKDRPGRRWFEAVVKFQRENPNSVVRRKDVAPLLKDVLQLVSKQSIINGFRACGLYPLNEDQIDYKKCLDIDKDEEEVQQSSSKPSTPAVQLRPSKEQLEISLSTIYTLLGPEKSQRLKQGQLLDNDDWHGMYKELVVQAAQQPDEESCVSVKQEQEEIVLQLLLDPINLQLHQPMKLSKSEDP
ncbi:hypothetical protein HAZT_HAZT009110 [Hyalella azteca]|uniref:HTH psq-type domain-containing protein n=1 Tax=Hyalella azteca TaxID=294128 RepID=A0A6A0GU04_HYAAZ|nr:hypothetical protein HAZT_HAZT009110 [Hyalella azteca]